MAGCNNLVKHPGTDPLTVLEKNLDLVRKIHSACPLATVYVQSILPLNPLDPACKEFNPAADKINAALKEAAKTNDFIFIDVTTPLKDENGDLRLECTTDGCHLNATGYFTWATELLQASRLMVIGDPYQNAK
jgi:lysophospholipase L1-like esterase